MSHKLVEFDVDDAPKFGIDSSGQSETSKTSERKIQVRFSRNTPTQVWASPKSSKNTIVRV